MGNEELYTPLQNFEVKSQSWDKYRIFSVRLLAWIIIAGDTEVFTERGATLYATSPKKKVLNVLLFDWLECWLVGLLMIKEMIGRLNNVDWLIS